VRTTGRNQRGEAVLEYVRWVMVRKRDAGAGAPEAVVPDLAEAVPPERLVVPGGLDFTATTSRRRGSGTAGTTTHRRNDRPCRRVTIEEAEHMMATRLWQNTAKVHFDATAREDGRRLIYGGHVISLAHALSFNGLANAQMIVGLNGGAMPTPVTRAIRSRLVGGAGQGRDHGAGGGAIRLRLVAQRAGHPVGDARDEAGKYRGHVLLDLDYWALMPV
jgi:2-methylfumaryl-CoA hydratase